MPYLPTIGAIPLVYERLHTVRAPQGPRRSLWVADKKIAATEQEAKLRINLEKPTLWRIVNPHRIGPIGQQVSYGCNRKPMRCRR